MSSREIICMFDTITQDALVICMFDKIVHIAFIIYVTWYKYVMAHTFHMHEDSSLNGCKCIVSSHTLLDG